MPRHPDPGCILCQITDADADESLWRALAAGEIAAWAATRGATLAQASTHMRRHGVLQPPPAARLNRDRAMERVFALPPRGRLMLELLHRIRVATAAQLAAVAIGSSPSDARAARDLLERMAAQDLVYGYWPHRPVVRGARRVEPVWLLGRDAVPWIERTFRQSLWSGAWAGADADVREDPLRHDVGANAVIAALARDARSGIRIAGGIDAVAAIDPRSWWGSRHLGIGLLEPRTRTPLTMRPDGFAALSVMCTHPAAEVTSLLLPFFLEYDRGSRPLDDVATQLRTYDILAASGAVVRRFPTLPEGIRIPVVMTFSKSSRRRAIDERLGDVREGIITMDEDAALRSGAWGEPRAIADGTRTPTPLVDALRATLAPLVATRRLHAHSTLPLDRTAARARTFGLAAAAPRAGGGDTVRGNDDDGEQQ